MLFEATLEVFEEASLRAQKTLTSLKELMHKINSCSERILQGFSSAEESSEIKKHLMEVCDSEDAMERELKDLTAFLEIQNEEIERDVACFKEMVSKAGIRSKLENISYLINKKMYLEEEKNQNRQR
ncbi:hypothetical protein J0A71_06g14260 [Encephalitozoon cuniculi]|nr:hypothetical protein J0A71_06g14260 [Encephalitozoon cuniculi]